MRFIQIAPWIILAHAGAAFIFLGFTFAFTQSVGGNVDYLDWWGNPLLTLLGGILLGAGVAMIHKHRNYKKVYR